jgi:hypothetical protein
MEYIPCILPCGPKVSTNCWDHFRWYMAIYMYLANAIADSKTEYMPATTSASGAHINVARCPRLRLLHRRLNRVFCRKIRTTVTEMVKRNTYVWRARV